MTVPMIFKGTGIFRNIPDLWSSQGQIVLFGVVIIVFGIILISKAGFGRDKAIQAQSDNVKGGFLWGLILCALAGVLSAGISFSFVYGQPITESVKAHGASEFAAVFSVWAIGLFGGAVINVLYPTFVMARKRTWKTLYNFPEILLASAIGIQFIFSIALLGQGMLLLGALGASIGFGIQQTTQLMGNQIVGFLSGEWKDVTGLPRKQMYVALFVLVFAAIVLAYSKAI
jgi:hypothetical protein